MTADYLDRAKNATEPLRPEERKAMPIVDCGEPLVSVGDTCPAVSVRLRIPARLDYVGDHVLMARQSVCDRLNQLGDLVDPWTVEVFDAYRPLAYQRWRYEQVRSQIAAEQPELAPEELEHRVDQWVAVPSDDLTAPPPHSTGGAIDMLLVDPTGDEPDYGSRPGDYSGNTSALHFTNAAGVDDNARSHRLRLLGAAVEVGFANHPAEWWHYSYGDQEWCLHTGQSDIAFYGRVD